MGREVLDATGLKCPQPIIKIAILSKKLPAGTKLMVKANCPAFPDDVKKWCTKNDKPLLICNEVKTGTFEAQIQL